MFEVLVASIGYAGSILSDKLILDRYRVPVMRFIPLLFIWLAVITAVFLPLWGGAEWMALAESRNLFLFFLMLAIAVGWNIFYYQGIQKENLAEFELIMLFSPLATVIMATILLPSERDWTLLITGVLASLALVLSRMRKHHVRLSLAAKRTMVAMLLMSFESILIKELLYFFSPVTLYFIRTTCLAVIFLLLYRPKLFALSPTSYALTIISAIFGVVQMVLKFYGFQSLGVVETTMVLLLGPFIVYLFSYMYFSEKLYKRDLAAVAVIVLCILYAEFWR